MKNGYGLRDGRGALLLGAIGYEGIGDYENEEVVVIRSLLIGLK